MMPEFEPKPLSEITTYLPLISSLCSFTLHHAQFAEGLKTIYILIWNISECIRFSTFSLTATFLPVVV